ncbi:hypothetical protein [Spiroplasma endosymbiont of Tricholauxania praeusta]|uniref:hypothetical protein n=1 Tax=Spiroplasma endosymbiont of Tricholauxania praeusta TaxID=3066296 RepID=UPI0030D2D0C0
MPSIENQSNYTLTKLIRTGISPICAMIGTSAYYGQVIDNPLLGSINSLLFGKKLGLDIWNLNQRPNTKTKLINSTKKILLGLGTIGLANYSKWTESNISPIIPTTPIPITTTTTTEGPPWLLLNKQENQSLMDWDTYISLNAYAVPTIIAGASEIIHNLLPIETTHHNQEMQETSFTNETARLINDNRFTINSETTSQYGSDNMSEVPLNHDNASLNWDYNHMSL